MLPTLKLCFPLFHERGVALGIVAAGKAGLDHLRHCIQFALAFVLHRRVDGGLGSADGHGRVVLDDLAIIQDGCL